MASVTSTSNVNVQVIAGLHIKFDRIAVKFVQKPLEETAEITEENYSRKQSKDQGWYSLFVLFCSCFLCGIIALIYSFKAILSIDSIRTCIISLDLLSQVDQAYRRGDIVAAQSASEKAKKWSYFGVLCGVMEFILMAAVWLVILYGFWKIQQ